VATNITSKGQVTIPKRVRDAMGLKPGAEVDVEFRDGSAVISPTRKAGKSDFRKRADKVRGTMNLRGMTTEEYLDWIRGRKD
jgi:AbrB family looped-hinge helix DNA binding protein